MVNYSACNYYVNVNITAWHFTVEVCPLQKLKKFLILCSCGSS